MGKRYYCDYCNKTMSCVPSIIRTHNNGLSHQIAKQEHFQKFKDPETILFEEKNKKQCGRFPYGQCQFGSICRFSHYSQTEIMCLENYVARKKSNMEATQPSFQDLYDKLQTEKSAPRRDSFTVLVDPNGVTHTLPWTYNEDLNKYGNSIPPSAKPISVNDFNNVTFSEWGSEY